MAKITAAPWDLTGIGFMHFFWGPKRRDPFSGAQVSGIGGVIIANYETSPVGPYHELLFIPGRLRYRNRSHFFISKIYVDSENSMISGRENWGIPKELAHFSFNKNHQGTTEIKVSKNNTLFFQGRLQDRGIAFPISTQVLPISLAQHWNDKWYLTRFTGSGRSKFCRTQFQVLDHTLFPDLSSFKSLGSFSIDPFRLSFPVPIVNV